MAGSRRTRWLNPGLQLSANDHALPPFYAAWHTPALHDSYAGVRINTSAQVIDLHDKVIPGLYYACGDSAGGFGQHGICRAATFGRIAGFHAAAQPA